MTKLGLVGVALLILHFEVGEASSDKGWHFGVGALSRGLTKISKRASGETELWGTAHYPFTLQTFFDVGRGWSWGPYVGYTLVGSSIAVKKSPDGGQKTTILMVGLPFYQDITSGSSSWAWSLGPTILETTIQGDGGTTQLSNGAGTATFGLPGTAQKSTTIAVQLGVSYANEGFRLELNSITEGLLSSYRRTFSFMLVASQRVF